MLSSKELKQYAIKSGRNIKEVEKLYKKAQSEAKSVGKEGSGEFVKEILEDLLELNESTQRIVKEFINAKCTFDEILEGLISGDIPQDSRPENVAKVVVVGQEDEIEEELLISKDGEDTVLDDDKKNKNNILVDGCDKDK